MDILIYVPGLTTRAKYIFTLLLEDISGFVIHLTDDPLVFSNSSDPKFSYSDAPLADELFFEASGLLFEDNIESQEITVFMHEKMPAFFNVSGKRSALPFDPFAAAFYLVTRYEEYLPFKADKFGRYRAPDSIAYKNDFLHIPVVNHWAEKIDRLIRLRYPDLPLHERKFKLVPTIDIDHAYAYKCRSLYRTMGGYGRALMRRDFNEIFERTGVLLSLRKDPFDTYDLINQLHKKYHLKPLYFFLYASYGGNDNNVDLDNSQIHRLIHKIDKYGKVGIHPSLSSARRSSRLLGELEGLATVLQRNLKISRQHFLHIKLPETYITMDKMGISDEYSMGYATEPGFRAGIASPFRFFDLQANSELKIIIHPVALMDVTLRDYFRLNPSEALILSKSIVDEVRNVGGELVTLWHNESFSGKGRWKGWEDVYEELLRYASPVKRK